MSAMSFLLAYVCVCVYMLQEASAACPNLCNHRGECNKFGRCECDEGYTGGDCSERFCPFSAAWSDMPTGTDQAHGEMECSNRGICDRVTGRCKCMDGITGTACERLACTKNCNHRGTCTTLSKIAEDTRDELSQSFKYEDVWDADKIMTCTCDPGFSGFDCGIQDCPTGDDPLTTGQVNEVQLIKCISNTGSFVLYFNGQPSRSIDASATEGQVEAALEHIQEITDVKVTFSHPGGVCETDANIVHVEFLEQFGNLAPLVPKIDEEMSSNGGSVKISGDGVTCFNDRDGFVHTSTDGTKEGEYCAGRGTCDTETGMCECYDTNGDGYLSSDGYGSAGVRGDCGFYKGEEVATCPGFLQCSGHGLCNSADGSFRCDCSDGWGGGDCSERECPKGLSWSAYPTADNAAHDKYTTCSDMGWCDRVEGKCECREPFYGQACEYMACGGGTEEPCHGHGRCMSMSEQAVWADKNGDATDYTYGNDPNNYYTWDAHRVFGCKCDEGYSGYDCSLRDCPRGNDLGTYEDSVEIQVLQCIADGGQFVLGFRQAETIRLNHNATDAEVEAALEDLTTLTDLNVTFYDYLGMVNETTTDDAGHVHWEIVPAVTIARTNAACNTSGLRMMVVTFETTHSDLPALIRDVSVLSDDVNSNGNLNTGVINIATDGEVLQGITSVKGTTENEFCNNRGICDLTTGVCHCFQAWASSDGKGNLGKLGDCGFRNDINSIGGKVFLSHADIYQQKYPEYVTEH